MCVHTYYTINDERYTFINTTPYNLYARNGNKNVILIHSKAKGKKILCVNKDIKSVIKVGVKGYSCVLIPFFDPDESNLSYVPPKMEGVLYIVSQKVLSVCNREDFVITINQMLLSKRKKLIRGFRSYID